MSYNERSKQTTIKYIKENLDTIRIRVQKGGKDALIDEATNAGYSAYSRYVIDAINEKAGRELWKMPRERNSPKKHKQTPTALGHGLDTDEEEC